LLGSCLLLGLLRRKLRRRVRRLLGSCLLLDLLRRKLRRCVRRLLGSCLLLGLLRRKLHDLRHAFANVLLHSTAAPTAKSAPGNALDLYCGTTASPRQIVQVNVPTVASAGNVVKAALARARVGQVICVGEFSKSVSLPWLRRDRHRDRHHVLFDPNCELKPLCNGFPA
jgi:hypothetical protein